MPLGGENCSDCHGNPPDVAHDGSENLAKIGAHQAHTRVQSDDATEDLSDCAVCHQGADTFGLPAHSTVPLVPVIGYNATDGTCSGACHISTVDDGYWTDTAIDGQGGNGLNCDSCHYYEATPSSYNSLSHDSSLGGTHGKHFDAGKVCTDCHDVVSADMGSHIERVHIDDCDDWTAADDDTILADRGVATEHEATVIAAALNTGIDNDPGTLTCDNMTCHDPSAVGYNVIWNTTPGLGCALCHALSPGSGSHPQHLAPSVHATYGKTIACADCHEDNGANTAHLDGSVTFAGGISYNSLSNHTCNTATCHNDGLGSPVETPQWGQPSATVCATCHSDGASNPQPATGRHGQHIENSFYVTDCGKCHVDATATQYNSANHLNASTETGSQITGGTLPQCTNTCHLVDATGTWTDANALDCVECHVSGKMVAAPSSGLHTGTLTISDNTHDGNFKVTRNEVTPSGTCTTCHTKIDLAANTPATHAAGGSMQIIQAGATLYNDISYTYGTPSSCAPGSGCHDDGGAWKRLWSTTAKNSNGTECANCHGDFDAGNGFVVGISLRHSKADVQLAGGHDGVDKCYICHTYKKGDATYYNIATGNHHRDGNIQLNDDMRFVDDGDTVHCKGCHDNDSLLGIGDGLYSFQDTYNGVISRWGRSMQAGPAANCTGCHVSNGQKHDGANESATVHAKHAGSPFSGTNCVFCHADSGPSGGNHNDGWVDFGGTYLALARYNSEVGEGGGDFPLIDCTSANGCHNAGIATSWNSATLPNGCDDCHEAVGKLFDQGVYPPESNAHLPHTGNNSLIADPDCDNCHGDGASTGTHASHKNNYNTVYNTAVTSYNAASGVCGNTCHYVAEGRAWNDGPNALICTDCHAGGGSLQLGAWPVVSNKHTQHTGNDNYVPGDCADCHGAGADVISGGTHTGHKDSVVTLANSITFYNSTAKTCTNDCHVANTTNDWTVGGSLVCRDCHIGTNIGGNGNLPASGLHGAMTAERHDDTLQGGNCLNCHDATPSSAHIQGGVAQSWWSGYNFNSANIVSYNSSVGCAADCHGDSASNGGTGKWSRKWNGVTDDKPDSSYDPTNDVCGNCHGTFTSGWRGGLAVNHTDPYGDNTGDKMNQHDVCEKCHGWGNANYNSTWLGSSNVNYDGHGDSHITMNGPVGTGSGYNNVSGGCAAACHGPEFVMNTNSGWTTNYGDFGSGDCDSCHTTNSVIHGDTVTESAGTHTLHKDSVFISGCTDCHPHSGAAGGQHVNGYVDFASQMNSLSSYNAAVAYPVTNCTTTSYCHDSGANDWTGGAGSLVCTDCHNTGLSKSLRPNDNHPPTSAKHTAHRANASYVGTENCDACHGTDAVSGGHVGHRDGTYTTAADITEYYNSTQTCGNNCHNASIDGMWTLGGTIMCADCHNSDKSLDASNGYIVDAANAPDTGEHTIHMSQDGAKGDYVAGGCADCHGHSGESVASHVNGPTIDDITVANSVSSYNAGDGGCINACHAVNPIPAGDWIDAGRLGCSDCHAGGGSLQLGTWPVVSNKHTQHIDNNTYVPGDCADCHGAGATEISDGTHTGHKDSVVTLANSVTLYNSTNKTCDNSCHIADTTNDWTLTATLACVDCHSGAYVGKLNRDNTSGLHVAYNATAHDDRFGAGDTGTCTSCHTSMTVPLPDTHVNGNDTETGSAFALFTNYNATNSDCTASCHRDGGNWRRLWKDAVDVAATGDPGQQVCGNCHGQYVSVYNSVGKGWRAGTVHFRSGSGYDENKGSDHNKTTGNTNACFDCHAYPGNAVHNSNYKIDFSSSTAGVPTGYNVAMGGTGLYCTGASCHDNNQDEAPLDTGSHTFFNSLSFAERNWVFSTQIPEGSCVNCHGDGVGEFWPQTASLLLDDYPNRAGAHEAHVLSIADQMTIDPATGPGSGTPEERNATCDYCHEKIGHSGDGSEPAELCREDTDGDGYVDVGYNTAAFNYIIGGGTDNGIGSAYYRRRGPGEPDGRCSVVDCHANAPYTAGWYGDTVSPGPVSNFVYNSALMTEPGTVVLEWIATGDDNGDDGTAYRYEVRYSDTLTLDTGANFNSATIAGNPPSVDRKNKQQRMTVKGLTPGTRYSFNLKTYDEEGNLAPLSAPVSYNALVDTVPPEFWGVDAVAVPDQYNTLDVSWGAAKDHSKPIDYKIWYSASAIDYNAAADFTTRDLSYRIEGLDPTSLYTIAVRAVDAESNRYNSLATVMSLPKDPPENPKTQKTYQAGATTLGTGIYAMADTYANAGGASAGLALTSGSSITFAGPQYAAATNAYGINFDIYAADSGKNTGLVLTGTFGYLTGTSFTPFPGATMNVSIGKRSARVRSFKFASLGGKISMNSRPAVQLSNTGFAADINLDWGDATQKGDLIVYEQPYNDLPNAPSFTQQPSGSGVINIIWSEASPTIDPNGDTVHYDLFADCTEAGLSPRHIIAKNLPQGTTSYPWDSIDAGVGLLGDATCTVTLEVGDGVALSDKSGTSHTKVPSNSWTVNNTSETVPPAAVDDLKAETRPKQGSIYLSWTAVGDNGANHGSRAAEYDVRFSTANITSGTVFNSLGVNNQATGEPVPDFSGTREGFELLGLSNDVQYYIALKVKDDDGNWSPMSNVETALGGPKCGVCHSTPPDESASAGNHAKHGYTMADCDKCHYDGVNSVVDYPMAHQDGVLVMGFDGNAYAAIENGSQVLYTSDGTGTGTVYYNDASGSGGFNDTGGDRTDNGTCSNTVGCHGPASPSWDVGETLSCSDCHGSYTGYSQTDPGNPTNPDWLWDRSADAYNRTYDDTSEAVQASPPVDLSGDSGGNKVGQHLKHLNFSFRFSKGDSCRLCHINNEHADGTVDVALDPLGSGEDAKYNTTADPGINGGVTCTGTTDLGCHGNPTTKPEWNDTVSVACQNCHFMGETLPPHIKDGGSDRACNWCHVEGHPQNGDTSTVVVPNNPAVGLNYRSGGIHLKKGINFRIDDLDGNGTVTEAEICWTCHAANSISEWGTDTAPSNAATAPANGNNYNFGSVSTPNWTTATWYSAYDGGGTGIFDYKSGAIQSTHSVNPLGSSAVTWNSVASPPRYEEDPDSNDLIRCSWCHDVHDLNLAENDVTNGAPFLRGSWLGSPYKEDGAPRSTITYTAVTNFDAVPRGGTGYTQMGGYFIDQNSTQPTTAGHTVYSSAGLCILCHTDNVDEMDYSPNGNEGLWIGANNGHSDSSIGGTTQGGANIFTLSDRSPVDPPVDYTANYVEGGNPSMGYQNCAALGASARGDGFRSAYGGYGFGVLPLINTADFGHQAFNWGVTVDDSVVDTGYHTFSCSKCHNPHASRLPKLMITNCLDTRHNDWDDGRTVSGVSSGTGVPASADNNNKTLSNVGSAQNCHRVGDPLQSGTGAGWNKVTPW